MPSDIITRTPHQPFPSKPLTIAGLIDDTLRVVFEHCCLTGIVPYFDVTEALKLCLVSRRWNMLVRDHPVLWTHIHLENDELAQIQFKLSKMVPLQILYADSSHICQHTLRNAKKERLSDRTFAAIKDNMHRVELFSLPADIQVLERLCDVDKLITMLRCSTWRQLRSCWFMSSAHSTQDLGLMRFQQLLDSHFSGNIPSLDNVLAHLQVSRPILDLGFLRGLTRLVLKQKGRWTPISMDFDLPSLLNFNPTLEELEMDAAFTIQPISEPGRVMAFLKTLCLRYIACEYVRPFLHMFSLPAIQKLELHPAWTVTTAAWGTPICFRDTLLRCPGLNHMLSSIESLSLSGILGSHMCIDATGPAMQLFIPAPDNRGEVFHDLLGIFPNLKRLCLASLYLEEEINLGTSPKIQTLEISGGAFCPILLRSLKVHSSLPSLSHLILREEIPSNDDGWKLVLDLLPESKSSMTCTVIGRSNGEPLLSNRICEDISRRNIHCETRTSSG